MKRMIGALVLLSPLALAACRKKSPEAATSADEGPSIRIEGSQVLVDGELAGTTRVIEELGRMQKIDELFDRLKARREKFKADNPSKPFPGRAKIAMPPEMPLLVFKSVFQTAAFAGYPNLVVDTAPEPVNVDAIIPGPPGEARVPRVELHVRVEDEAITLGEWRSGTSIYERRLETAFDAADIDQRVNHAIAHHVLRSDLRAEPVVDVIVHGDNRVPFKKLAAVFRGLSAAHERLAGPGDTEGAFNLRLAVN